MFFQFFFMILIIRFFIYLFWVCVGRRKSSNEHGGKLKEAILFQLTGWTVRRGIFRRAVAGEEAPPQPWAGLWIVILADTPSDPICLRSYYTYLLSSKTLYSFMIWHVHTLCYITYVLKPYPHHIHFVGNWNMCVSCDWGGLYAIFDQLLWNIFGIKDYSCRHVKVVSRI